MAENLEPIRSERHQKESEFISKKRRRNLFEGIKEGNVELKDLSPDDLIGIESFVATELKIHAQLMNPRVKPSRAILCAGQHVFVDKRITISDASLQLKEFVRCVDPSVADVFVVPDVANIGQRISWYAGLNGCAVTVKDTICHAKTHGVVKVFNKATATKRVVWMSDNFIASHAIIATIVNSAAVKAGSKWVMVGSREDFVRRARALARKAPTQALALINKSEMADEDSCVWCFGLLRIFGTQNGQ